MDWEGVRFERHNQGSENANSLGDMDKHDIVIIMWSVMIKMLTV